MRLFAAISTIVLGILIYAAWSARSEILEHTSTVGGPLTGIDVEQGETLRIDGTIAETAKRVPGLDVARGCVASMTRIDYVWTEKVDVGHGSERKYEDRTYVRPLLEHRAGADPIPVNANPGIALVGRTLWPAHEYARIKQSQRLPDWAAAHDVASAPSHDGVFMQYQILEACLSPGDPVFVTGQVERITTDGTRVTSGPGTTPLVFSPGTQADALETLGARSDHTSKWLYILLTLQGLVLLVLTISEFRRRSSLG